MVRKPGPRPGRNRERVRVLVKELGWSYGRAAAELGISKARVGQIVRQIEAEESGAPAEDRGSDDGPAEVRRGEGTPST